AGVVSCRREVEPMALRTWLWAVIACAGLTTDCMGALSLGDGETPGSGAGHGNVRGVDAGQGPNDPGPGVTDDASAGADGGTPVTPDGATPTEPTEPPPVRPPSELGRWLTANEYSWDGSWTPATLPVPGIADEQYGAPGGDRPPLPPGEWDWDPGSGDMANWRNFRDNVGTFEALLDMTGAAYGWRFVRNGAAADFSGPAAYYA